MVEVSDALWVDRLDTAPSSSQPDPVAFPLLERRRVAVHAGAVNMA